MATIRGEKITAVNLSDVIIVSKTHHESQRKTYLTPEDLGFQEERKKRKFKRLDFEVR